MDKQKYCYTSTWRFAKDAKKDTLFLPYHKGKLKLRCCDTFFFPLQVARRETAHCHCLSNGMYKSDSNMSSIY